MEDDLESPQNGTSRIVSLPVACFCDLKDATLWTVISSSLRFCASRMSKRFGGSNPVQQIPAIHCELCCGLCLSLAIFSIFARSKAWAVVQGRGEADAILINSHTGDESSEMLHDLENSAEFQGKSMKLL